MTHIEALASGGGLYALPTDAAWLATLLNKSGSTRAQLFVALNEACAAIAANHEEQARAALATALGQPRPIQWHGDTHPLRSPEAARAACAALIASGYQP